MTVGTATSMRLAGRALLIAYAVAAALALWRLRVAPPEHQIAPGQERLLGDALGGAEVLAGGCSLRGASVERTFVVARYACEGRGEVTLELRHPDDDGAEVGGSVGGDAARPRDDGAEVRGPAGGDATRHGDAGAEVGGSARGDTARRGDGANVDGPAGADARRRPVAGAQVLRRTAKFALLGREDAPPDLVAAVAARVAAREDGFRWGAPDQPHAEDRTRGFPPRLALAVLLALLGAAAWAGARVVRGLLAPGAARPPWFGPGLAALCLAAVALRGALAARTVLALDETWLLRYPHPLAYLAGSEVRMNPPLYPLLAWPVALLTGGDPVAQRVLAVALGAATVALLGLIGARLLGAAGGLAVAAIAALHPMLVATGAAHRAYALAPLVVALALAAAERARETGERRDRLAAALLLAALPWTHYVLAAAAAPLAAWIALSGRAAGRRALAGWAAPALVAALAIAPLVPVTRQGAAEKAAQHLLRPDEAGGALRLLGDGALALAGWSPPASLAGHPVAAKALALCALAVVIAALVAGARRRAADSGPGPEVWVGGAAIAAPLVMATRYATVRDLSFVGALVPVILGLGALVVRARAFRPLSERRWWILPGVVFLLFAGPLARMLRDTDPAGIRQAARAAAADPATPVLSSFVNSFVVLRRESAALGAPLDPSRLRHLTACDPGALRQAAAGAPSFLLVGTPCTVDALGLAPDRCRPLSPGAIPLRCDLR